MRQKTRQILGDLVERAKKLERYRLDRHISEIGLGFHVRRGSEEGLFITDFDLPDEEKMDASMLTLRLFMQQNEDFSFPQLKYLANDPGLSDDFRQFLRSTRRAYYDFLNGHPTIIAPGFFGEDEHPTRMEILNVVLYGKLAHSDFKRRQKYEHWARDEIRESVLLQEFSRITQVLLQWIYQLAERCKQELEEYSK